MIEQHPTASNFCHTIIFIPIHSYLSSLPPLPLPPSPPLLGNMARIDHFCSMRKRATPIYLSLLYFFLMALNFTPDLDAFSKAKHISLKHRIRVSRSGRSPSNALVSDLPLRTESASMRALMTMVLTQQVLARPQKMESSSRYFPMQRVLPDSRGSLPLESFTHLSATASMIWRGVVRLRLKARARSILPSMALSSLAEQEQSVTCVKAVMRGGQISSYLLAIHRQATPTSWQSWRVTSVMAVYSLRQARARKRVCSRSSKEECTSTIQSTRIARIYPVTCVIISSRSRRCSDSMCTRISASQSAVASRGVWRGEVERERGLESGRGRGLSVMEDALGLRWSRLVMSLPKTRLLGKFLSLHSIALAI